MNPESSAKISRLLDEMLRLYSSLMAVTRRLVINFTPAALSHTLGDRATLLCCIEAKRSELEKTAIREEYEHFEQCRMIRGYIAGISVLDRTIALLIAARMNQLKRELSTLPVNYMAARNYLKHSRK